MPTSQPIVVLDPGHGGTTPAGASTADRTVAGLSERTLTLALARRVRALLTPACTVMLTRDSDANVSLDGRAAFARLVGADYFVSLHFNAAADPVTDSTEAFVARNSSTGDRELANALHEAVRGALGTTGGGVLAADLGVVARHRHLDRTRVALLEACDLSNPRRAGELRDPAGLERLAQAVAAAIVTRCRAELGNGAQVVPSLGVDLEVTGLATGVEPLDEGEWDLVLTWLAAGTVLGRPLGGDADANALRMAGVLYCQRQLQQSITDPAMCPDPADTWTDPEVARVAAEVAARGPIIHWPARTLTERQRYVVDRLVTAYGYPVNGAAGIVGNLTQESHVLPSRIQGSAQATPLRTTIKGQPHDWSFPEIINSSSGIGLAQWSEATRRRGLFGYAYGSAPAGSRILFDMDAQIDYLVHELRTASDYRKSEALLMAPEVTLDAAADEFLFIVERPDSVLGKDRAGAAVQAVVSARRALSQEALRAYQNGR